MTPGFPPRVALVGALLSLPAAPLLAQSGSVSNSMSLSVTVVRGCTVTVEHDPDQHEPAVSLGCREAKSFAAPVVTTVPHDPADSAEESGHDLVVINF
jgi:hypothetical protein